MTQFGSCRLRSGGLVVLIALLASPLLQSCGKKGAPMPPIKVRPETVADLTVNQVGRHAVLSFSPPTVMTTGDTLAEVAEVVVLKLREEEVPIASPTGAAPRGRFIPIYEFKKKSETFRRLGRADLDGAMVDDRIEVVDPLTTEAFGGAAAERLYYGVVVQDAEGRESEISNIVSLVPVEPPGMPQGLEFEVEAGRVTLDWSPPSSGATPVGYTVYRQVGDGPLEAATLAVLTETEFVDYGAFDEAVAYEVRATATTSRPLVESEEAARVTVQVTDEIPPMVPRSLRISSGQGSLELYWEGSPDGDLDGYLVYRSTTMGGSFEKLTEVPVPETVFIDSTAEVGATYFYAVSSVDEAGNESERSDVVSGQR